MRLGPGLPEEAERVISEETADSLPAAAVDAAATAAKTLADLPTDVLRGAMSISAEAAGMPVALVKTLQKAFEADQRDRLAAHTQDQLAQFTFSTLVERTDVILRQYVAILS